MGIGQLFRKELHPRVVTVTPHAAVPLLSARASRPRWLQRPVPAGAQICIAPSPASLTPHLTHYCVVLQMKILGQKFSRAKALLEIGREGKRVLCDPRACDMSACSELHVCNVHCGSRLVNCKISTKTRQRSSCSCTRHCLMHQIHT